MSDAHFTADDLVLVRGDDGSIMSGGYRVAAPRFLGGKRKRERDRDKAVPINISDESSEQKNALVADKYHADADEVVPMGLYALELSDPDKHKVAPASADMPDALFEKMFGIRFDKQADPDAVAPEEVVAAANSPAPPSPAPASPSDEPGPATLRRRARRTRARKLVDKANTYLPDAYRIPYRRTRRRG